MSKKGVAIVPRLESSVTVEHGLTTAPTVVFLTPKEFVGSWWIADIGKTHFTINIQKGRQDPVLVMWLAE